MQVKINGYLIGRSADLVGADLQYADLQYADLHDADLRGSDLRGADLRGADLGRACLQDADLRNAYLHGAYLCRADLCRADLQDADLRGADLSMASGILRLPVGDPRGYDAVATLRMTTGDWIIWAGDWIIWAGCRCFTITEAEQHWGPGYSGCRDIGDRYLYAIQWLKTKSTKQN